MSFEDTLIEVQRKYLDLLVAHADAIALLRECQLAIDFRLDREQRAALAARLAAVLKKVKS